MVVGVVLATEKSAEKKVKLEAKPKLEEKKVDKRGLQGLGIAGRIF